MMMNVEARWKAGEGGRMDSNNSAHYTLVVVKQETQPSVRQRLITTIIIVATHEPLESVGPD
jgi:hypothetical protein